MDLFEAIKARHSVRQFTDREIDGSVLNELNQVIEACNQESHLNIQLIRNEPASFSGMLAHYGKFRNVKNYIAIVGKKAKTLDEQSGYYGEKIVLRAQQLGLNTCWVVMTFNKGKAENTIRIQTGEKLVCVIAIGYGLTNGTQQKTKSIEQLCAESEAMPDWFLRGMEAVQLAPSAMHQQKFRFKLDGNKVKATSGIGFYTKIDLGIAKYHFEVGAGKDNFVWAG